MFNEGEYFTCLKCGLTFADTTKVDERNIVVPVHGCPHCAAQQSVQADGAEPVCPICSSPAVGKSGYCRVCD